MKNDIVDKVLFIMPSIGRDTINRAIDSLTNQTLDKWELCIVYDCIEKIPHIPKDSRIFTHNLSNKTGKGKNSAGNVRNYALDKYAHKYRWIGFIDDDDSVHHKYVELLYKKYSEYDFILFRMEVPRVGIVPPLSIENEILCGKVGISFCNSNKLSDNRFEPFSTEDFKFLSKISKQTSNYIFTQEVGYFVKH